MAQSTRILYCHCKYAKVIAPEVKRDVLKALCESGVAFDAVPDLCEMSARKDPALGRLAGEGGLMIAACYPRAVKWLFHAAGAPLKEDGVHVCNMRTQTAEEIVPLLIDGAKVPQEQPA